MSGGVLSCHRHICYYIIYGFNVFLHVIEKCHFPLQDVHPILLCRRFIMDGGANGQKYYSSLYYTELCVIRECRYGSAL